MKTNRAGDYFHLAALLTGGCIGVLAGAAITYLLKIETLTTLFTYGAALLLIPITILSILGLIARR